jgi:hypothetical protein
VTTPMFWTVSFQYSTVADAANQHADAVVPGPQPGMADRLVRHRPPLQRWRSFGPRPASARAGGRSPSHLPADRVACLPERRRRADRLHTEAQRDITLKAAAQDSDLAFQRSSRLYKAGLTDFLRVLVDERAAYAAEDLATQSELESVSDAVALYKALGAGWEDVYPVDESAQHDVSGPATALTP